MFFESAHLGLWSCTCSMLIRDISARYFPNDSVKDNLQPDTGHTTPICENDLQVNRCSTVWCRLVPCRGSPPTTFWEVIFSQKPKGSPHACIFSLRLSAPFPCYLVLFSVLLLLPLLCALQTIKKHRVTDAFLSVCSWFVVTFRHFLYCSRCHFNRWTTVKYYTYPARIIGQKVGDLSKVPFKVPYSYYVFCWWKNITLRVLID